MFERTGLTREGRVSGRFRATGFGPSAPSSWRRWASTCRSTCSNTFMPWREEHHAFCNRDVRPVFAIVAGIYWAFIDRPEAHEASLVRRRLRASRPVAHQGVAERATRLSNLGGLDRLLRRPEAWSTLSAPDPAIGPEGHRRRRAPVLSAGGALTFALLSVYLGLTLLGIPLRRLAVCPRWEYIKLCAPGGC